MTVVERGPSGNARVVAEDGTEGWLNSIVLSRRPPAGQEAAPGSALSAPYAVTPEQAEGGPTLVAGCVAYLVANGLLALSALLPWETVGALSASGLELNRGWVVLIAALVGLAMAGESLRRGRPISGLRLVQWGSAAAALGMFIVELVVIGSACSGDDDLSNLLCVRPGLGIGAVLAGTGGLGLGLAATFLNPRREADWAT